MYLIGDLEHGGVDLDSRDLVILKDLRLRLFALLLALASVLLLKLWLLLLHEMATMVYLCLHLWLLIDCIA